MVAPDLVPHLRAAKDLIDGRFGEPLDLDRLAARASCSRYHFHRAFTATYGQSPGRYLTARRIERAQELLRSANLTVSEICMLVGFSSVGSFTTQFRRVVGRTPTAYRRTVVEAGGPPPIPGCFVLMWSHGSATQEKPPDPSGS